MEQESQTREPVLRYADLRTGDYFIFEYRHHNNDSFAWLLRKLEVGYLYKLRGAVHPDPPDSMPMRVRLVPPEIETDAGMILKENLPAK